MAQCLAYLRVVAATLIVLAGCSISQAGLFRRGYVNYYYYPACPTVVVAAPAQTVTAMPSPGAQTVYMPVEQPSAAPAATYVPAEVPQYQYQGGGGGIGNMPRSSWDFGKFPPY